MILGSEGGILASQSRRKPLGFLLAWQMKCELLEVFTISPERGAVAALSGQRKKLPPNDFRKPAHRVVAIPSAILIIQEPPVVY